MIRPDAHHSLRVDFDADALTVNPQCSAPAGAPCRLVCEKDCGEDDALILDGMHGDPYHAIQQDDGEYAKVHRMIDGDRCRVAEAFDFTPLLQNEESERFTVGVIPINPQFDGDRYSWTRIPQQEDGDDE